MARRMLFCEHCGKQLHRGKDGAAVLLTKEVTGLPDRTAWIHDACFWDFITKLEAQRKPITERTVFKDGIRHDNAKGAV